MKHNKNKRPKINFKLYDGHEGIYCKSCGLGGRFEINTHLWLDVDADFSVSVYGVSEDFTIRCSNCDTKLKAPDQMLQSIHNSVMFLEDMINGTVASWPLHSADVHPSNP